MLIYEISFSLEYSSDLITDFVALLSECTLEFEFPDSFQRKAVFVVILFLSSPKLSLPVLPSCRADSKPSVSQPRPMVSDGILRSLLHCVGHDSSDLFSATVVHLWSPTPEACSLVDQQLF